MLRRMILVGTGLVIALLLAATPALAQITTGTVSGTVRDSGGVIPGATVVLISDTRGTRSSPALTNETGTYVFPNVTADTYTIEVSLQAFKTVRRAGIIVTGGDRVGVQPITIEAGTISENRHGDRRIAAGADAERRSWLTPVSLLRRRSTTCSVARNNFTSMAAFTPGVVQTGDSAGATRQGGAGQNNIMAMDGISADGHRYERLEMLNMNVDAIGEVKILTQGYQAGVRPIERPGRSPLVTKTVHQQVPRLGLRHPDELGLGRQQLGQREERRSEGEAEHEDAGATPSAVRSASRVATTSCSSFTRKRVSLR